MNILVLSQLYPEPDDHGGHTQTKIVEYFAKEWVKAGHRVVVIHNASKFPTFFYFVPEKIVKIVLSGKNTIKFSYKARHVLARTEYGIRVVRYPMLKLWQGATYSDRVISRQVAKIVSYIDKIGFKPDLILGHFAYPQLPLIYELKKRYNSITSIVFHNDCNVNTIQKYCIFKYINQIDVIGCRSKFEAKNVMNLLALRKEPFICYSGLPDDMVNNEVYSNDRFDGPIKTIIYAGGIERVKGVYTLVSAFGKVFQNSFDSKCLLIGDGPEKYGIETLVHNLNIDDKVTVTGWVSRSEVFSYMRMAHCFVMVSKNETFGMVYMEAMLCGCIVIASKDGGFDGIIQHGINGYLCEQNNEAELENLLGLIKNESAEKLKDISRNAYNTARQYTESKVAKYYLDNVTNNY